jgi:hypothetical protein
MRKQIHHMIKYKYVPFTLGKKSYKGNAPTQQATHNIYSTLDRLTPQSNFAPSSVSVSTGYQPPKQILTQQTPLYNVNASYQQPSMQQSPLTPFSTSSPPPPQAEYRPVSLTPPPQSGNVIQKTGKRD